MKASRRSRWTAIAAVLVLAVIAAVASYSHMYELALRHGEPEWRTALFPLSVDGMIVGAPMTLLSDARNGRKGGLLPWALLITGSGASPAAIRTTSRRWRTRRRTRCPGPPGRSRS